MGGTQFHVVFEEPLKSLVSPIEVRLRVAGSAMVDALRHALEARLLVGATLHKVLSMAEITEGDRLDRHVDVLTLDTADALPLVRCEWNVLGRLVVRGDGV